MTTRTTPEQVVMPVAAHAAADSAALVGPLEQLHRMLRDLPALTSPAGVQRLAEKVRELLKVDLASVLDTSGDPPLVVTASPPDLSGLAQSLGSITWPAIVVSGSGVEVHCPDLRVGPDTPGADAVRALLLHSVAAFPLLARGKLLGALSLYDRSARAWAKVELALGRVAADLVALHLHHATAARSQEVLSGQLQTALNSRVVIEQAKGVLAASEGISVDEAFTRMREQARSANAKLVDVAAAVVYRGVAPAPDGLRVRRGELP